MLSNVIKEQITVSFEEIRTTCFTNVIRNLKLSLRIIFLFCRANSQMSRLIEIGSASLLTKYDVGLKFNFLLPQVAKQKSYNE